jgi:hypothetical protein
MRHRSFTRREIQFAEVLVGNRTGDNSHMKAGAYAREEKVISVEPAQTRGVV